MRTDVAASALKFSAFSDALELLEVEVGVAIEDIPSSSLNVRIDMTVARERAALGATERASAAIGVRVGPRVNTVPGESVETEVRVVEDSTVRRRSEDNVVEAAEREVDEDEDEDEKGVDRARGGATKMVFSAVADESA